MGFLTKKELEVLGFKKIGNNVLISNKASIYNPANISIGSNVRIDDFCILSAGDNGISIGNYVHIACYVSLIGNALIEIKDFVGISSKSSVYSSSDDYSGNFLVGPTIPIIYKNVISKSVVFENHALIGAGSIILPGTTVNEGATTGAFTLVTKDLLAWSIYSGIPAKLLKPRNKNLLKYVNFLK